MFALPSREVAAAGLLVTDVIMPDLSGPQLAARLTEHMPGLRVLYVSGYAEHSALNHGVSGTAAGFLGKPFSTEALARKVRELLDAPPA